MLHHHLRRGGVTRVIESTARILVAAGEEVEVWSGEDGSGILAEGVGIRLMPVLAYRQNFSQTDCDSLIAEMLTVHAEGDVWHIHNHTLGKNPVVTEAVRVLAENGIPMVLQLHDFAEDGRPANLQLLRESLPGQIRKMYPVADHILYAVLQKRDRNILQRAGIPDDRIMVLPNPISSGMTLSPPQIPPVRILYLTRGIRRKNIGEFLYWAKGLAGKMEFSTSLIPENPGERQFFDPWVAYARDEGIPVNWGTGMTGKSFREVVESCDACITTSVGEGFGMSFLEPFAMDRPVLGRDLPAITAGFKEDGVNLDPLYAELPVPLKFLDDGFWNRALAAVNQWRMCMGLTSNVNLQDLKAAWVVSDNIDFGRLDEAAQRQVLNNTSMGTLETSVLAASSAGEIEFNRETIYLKYSDSASLARLQQLYGKVNRVSACEYADAECVRDAFTDLKNISLLRL